MLDNMLQHPSLQPLMTGEELARLMRYTGVTSAFRAWLKQLSITPVPGRNDIYDPRHVRRQLDLAQDILSSTSSAPSAPGAVEKPLSMTEERRQRRGK